MRDFSNKIKSQKHKIDVELARAIGLEVAKKVAERIFRFSFFIAPLNPQTGNTQTMYRWDISTSNPQYADFTSCCSIAKSLTDDLCFSLKTQDFSKFGNHFIRIEPNRDEIDLLLRNAFSQSSRIGSLELPVWYIKELEKSGDHTGNNIQWFIPWKELFVLRSRMKHKQVLTKIQVKSYLTDRRQTGDYQTNREIRWETFPHSPQYSSRYNCMEIEAKLIAQTFTFTNAPRPDIELIEAIELVLGDKFRANSFRCPISGKSITYENFVTQATDSGHGRSGYQVGHINPLAASGAHIATNTSWITDLGNRVQGESSLEEITGEIFGMANFHRERLDLDWKTVQEISEKSS